MVYADRVLVQYINPWNVKKVTSGHSFAGIKGLEMHSDSSQLKPPLPTALACSGDPKGTFIRHW